MGGVFSWPSQKRTEWSMLNIKRCQETRCMIEARSETFQKGYFMSSKILRASFFFLNLQNLNGNVKEGRLRAEYKESERTGFQSDV